MVTLNLTHTNLVTLSLYGVNSRQQFMTSICFHYELLVYNFCPVLHFYIGKLFIFKH